MNKIDLTKFYEEKDRLSYNPRTSLLAKRSGFRKLISFDDRFVVVSGFLKKLITENKKEKVKILDIGVGDGVYESLLYKNLSAFAEESSASAGFCSRRSTRRRYPERKLEGASFKKAEFYGLDISKVQLSKAGKFLKEAKVVDLNKGTIPYKSNFFDIVIVSEILEHVFYPDKVLNDSFRVLKDGGYLVLTYPNSGALQLRLSLLLIGYSPLLNYSINKVHIRFFNKEDILKIAGIKRNIIHYQGLGSFLFGKWNFPIKIITPRFLEIIGNKFLPNLALGNLIIFKK